jgi:phosphoribosylformylglycinamidine cyclo-ligase
MAFTYKDSGVDIEAGNKSVDLIKNNVKESFTKGVLNHIGGFGALFQPDLTDIKEPVIVSSTDGVGTKIIIAMELNQHDTVGIDLVAMSVNDLICTGAKPLFFLDYIACGKLVPEKIADIVKGITEGCKQSGCALIGGETAEMPDMYSENEYDLAGFAVGIVDKSKIIDGTKMQEGDSIIAIPSSGIHSNGYSLARKVLLAENAAVDRIEALEKMLVPTRLYANDVENLVKKFAINGIAHITGGGLNEKLGRIIPEGLTAKITKGTWDTPEIFKLIQNEGKVDEAEMYNVFNMGIGLAIITKPENTADILASNPTYREVGVIEKGDLRVDLV